MPRIIYTAIFYLAIPIYFLRLIWKGFSNPDYLLRWNERLGLDSNLSPGDRNVLWVHAVSVGEVNASIPLIRSLLKNYQKTEILVTTTTPTGSQILLNKMGSRVKHQYMPLDIPFCVNKFLDKWRPKALLLLETEIWPNLLEICEQRNIFTALVNARLSEKSKKNYKRVKPLIASALNKLDLLIAQYNSDAVRFKEINPELEVLLCGNLKFDQEIPEQITSISNSIRESWSKNGTKRPTLIASSTHESEEKFVLDSFKEVLSLIPQSLLIIVPRHPERFDQVYRLISETTLLVARRSKKEDVTENTQVLLGDTMGELNFLYSVSDIAFVGGSLIDHGGQNLLEPAALGLPICSGSSLRNFQEIADELQDNDALFIVRNEKDLTDFFLKLINNPSDMKEIGNKSQRVFQKNRGALDKITTLLDQKLPNFLI